jgi:hypothetical protein
LTFCALPVPDTGTICGAPLALSLRIKWPLAGVVSVGLKVTKILQLLPGASIFVEHCVETLNTGLSVVAVSIVTVAPPFLPAFFTVALFGLLVAPTLVDLPKLRYLRPAAARAA